jgi:hypothetical protein
MANKRSATNGRREFYDETTEDGDRPIGSLSIDRLTTESLPYSYVLRTDGETIDAFPHQQGLDKYTDEPDIGLLLEQLIVDELPPKGRRGEGAGHIFLKAGEYPGDLSSPDTDGTILPTQTWITGELASHYEHQENPTSGPVPQQSPPVLLRFSESGFTTPSDTEYTHIAFPRLTNLELAPVGDAGTAIHDRGGPGKGSPWDWFFIDGVMITNRVEDGDMEAPFWFNRSRDGPIFMRRMHVLQWSGVAHLSQGCRIVDCHINPQPGTVWLTGNARMIRCKVGTEPPAEAIRMSDNALVSQCEIPQYHERGKGIGISIEGAGRNSYAEVPGTTVTENVFTGEGFNKTIDICEGSRHAVKNNIDTSPSNISIAVGEKTHKVDIEGHRSPLANEDIRFAGDPSNNIVNGTILVNSTPDESDFSTGDAGRRIIDVSTSPPTEYTVLADGSLISLG